MTGVAWIFYLPTGILCLNSISDRRSTLDSMCLFPGVGLGVQPPEMARQHAAPFPCSLDSGLGHGMPKSLASLSQPCGSVCFVSRVPVFDLDGFQVVRSSMCGNQSCGFADTVLGTFVAQKQKEFVSCFNPLPLNHIHLQGHGPVAASMRKESRSGPVFQHGGLVARRLQVGLCRSHSPTEQGMEIAPGKRSALAQHPVHRFLHGRARQNKPLVA